MGRRQPRLCSTMSATLRLRWQAINMGDKVVTSLGITLCQALSCELHLYYLHFQALGQLLQGGKPRHREHCFFSMRLAIRMCVFVSTSDCAYLCLCVCLYLHLVVPVYTCVCTFISGSMHLCLCLSLCLCLYLSPSPCPSYLSSLGLYIYLGLCL